MIKLKFGRALLAGIAGTTAMTALMWMAPAMGFPPMNIGEMLGSAMGASAALGWIGHFMIGTVLALGYAGLVAGRLRGPALARGLLYGLAPWLAAQLVVMPMMGMGLFAGSFLAALGSLMGHLLYGAVVGVVYGLPDGTRAQAAERLAHQA